MKQNIRIKSLVIAIGLVVTFAPFTAYSESSGKTNQKSFVIKKSVMKRFDPSRVEKGEKLFLEHCKKCHGENAVGDPKWKEPDTNDQLRPPPLDGNAHSWHHSTRVLANYIKNGSLDMGGTMKGFKGIIKDKDIRDIVIYFQSLWSNDIYGYWLERNKPVK